MDNRKKVEIYNKFEQKKEVDIMLNKGVELPFGSSTVKVKSLSWRKSTEFEKEVKRVIVKFKDFIKLDTNNLELVVNELFNLLNEDLIALANKATNGYITIEKIDKYDATKNEVARVVLESVNINYSYVKNLIAQFRKK